MTAPLANIRVLELARILAGPWCGQLLADLGADVVKIERKGAGDDTRQWGPPFIEGKNGAALGAAYFHSCNRGKRSVEADFESEDGRNIVRTLARNADVLVENFKLGGLKKYGLDYENLQKINPRLIYCSITGFGQDGPYASRAGYDFLIQGMGGAMHLTGAPDGAPSKSGIAIADIFTGLYAANAVQAAIIERERTGKGTYIDCALLDTQVSVLGYQALNYFVSGNEPKRMGNAHPNIVPYDVFPVADGNIIIATGNNGQYRKLCEALKRPELADDPRFVTSEKRVNNRAEFNEVFHAITRQFERNVLLPQLDALSVPAGPINTIGDVFADAQVRHRGVRIDIPNEHAAAGSTPGLRSPIVINGAAMASHRPAPALGMHTDEVLREAGWIKGDHE